MSLRDQIQSFARQLEQESNAAFDLWTWLPSHQAAKKSHGDYASEFTPDPADIMREAAIYLAQLKGHEPSSETVQEWYGCPCQDCDLAYPKPEKENKG